MENITTFKCKIYTPSTCDRGKASKSGSCVFLGSRTRIQVSNHYTRLTQIMAQLIVLKDTDSQELNFTRRIKSHLPFAGIIKSSPYSPRFQDKG